MSTLYLSDKPKVKNAEGKAWSNVQDLIGFGYRQCTRRTYFIRFKQVSAASKLCNHSAAANAAKQFFDHGVFDLNQCSPKELMSRLGHLKEQIAKQVWPDCGKSPFVGLDIAFTYTGLEKLGVRRDLLEVFRKKNTAYYENAFSRAAKHLGDTGYSDPMQWASIYKDQGGKSIDLVLIAHFSNEASAPSAVASDVLSADKANDKLVLAFENALQTQLLGELTAKSVTVEGVGWVEESAPLSDGRVYFGYKDGLTSPTYVERGHLDANGQRKKVYGHRTEHALGELLLGYPRNDGDNAYGNLNLTYKASPQIQLQALPVDEALKCFFKDSSFGVLRKMQQKTQTFEGFVKASAAACSVTTTPEWIKAKIMGRTTEGRLLQATDTEATLANTTLNAVHSSHEVGFHDPKPFGNVTMPADAAGAGCPFSSHIRRMNPRDDPVSPFIHRPLLRRGMPYTTTNESFGEPEVGLSGLFLCADIAEQFEHLVGIWGNKRVIGVPDTSNVRDPIIGNHGGDGHSKDKGTFFLNSKEDRAKENLITKFTEPFVITRGCSYLWFPSVSTLDLMPSYFQS